MIDLKDVKIIKTADWQVLYINGKIMAEGWNITAEDLFDALDVYYTVEYKNE